MSAPADGTNRASLDRANLNTLSDAARLIALGSLLAGQMPQVRRNVDMDALGAGDYTLSTLDCLVLPNHAKAHSLLRGTVRAGTGGTGEYTGQAYGTTPTTTQFGIAPNGDIVFLATDVVTDVDVSYIPERGDVIETVFPVVSNAIVFPTALTARGVVLLAECEALEGTATGKKVVLVPGGAPAAGQCSLTSVTKAGVTFAAADAVTRARVVLVVTAAEELHTVLEGSAQVL